MIIGYARTSTLDQLAGLEGQHRDLRAAGCEKIFSEQVSSVDAKARKQLADALDFLREGDTLVVTKLDRLARSVSHLLAVLETVVAKGAALRILSTGIDTGTATGKLMLTVLGSVAEFERSIMLERQREGIAKAKAEGRYVGRKPTARAKTKDILRLAHGGMKPLDIADALGVGKSSVYRILSEQRHNAQLRQ
ncbi:recombinase family protein [Pontivivens insulae]|uniref:DNA-invertase hin n=1 Tax=Pontivivens insulae TaxID=1639689 RepID=A0A2R8AA65_9RHOB|nr:recombinase family protein [Pontivivens insulae]RED12888.1 DNA invertase Pin-like site-specific DNA recombinase [Pontivivens insulae]SPF28980.1 DNA-invertase hin [Pontivivens insulae]